MRNRGDYEDRNVGGAGRNANSRSAGSSSGS